MKICTFLLFFFVVGAWGQQSSKLNIELWEKLENIEKDDYTTVYISALVKGELKAIATIVQQNPKNKYKYGIKNIASVFVSLETVRALLLSPKVQRVEARTAIMQQLDYIEDTAVFCNNNVWAAHAGGGDLPRAMQGQGVLLAMIDDGIEWRHPDFLNADSSSRIMYLWDQLSSDARYAEGYFGYGASWDSTDLNRHQCTHVVGDHGSHVMGIAGGNGLASGQFVGIAPKADIACVKVKNQGFLSNFVDGLHYLYRMADTMGQACVINSSVGAYQSGHDSKDLYAQLVANMLRAKSGRALVQAAGNAREYAFHLGGSLQNETAKTWFRKPTGSYYTTFSIYADTADFKNIDFSLQLINPNSHLVQAQTAIYNVVQDFVFSGSIAQKQQILFYDANGRPVRLFITVDQYENAYQIQIKIGSYYYNGDWQLTTSGSGQYDIWSKPSLTGTATILSNINIPFYLNPDNRQSIVGFWTTLEEVITVGSYQNRDFQLTYHGDTSDLRTANFPKLGISPFSSLGPTRTGVQKPDITASGGQVLSAFGLGTLQQYRLMHNNRLNADGWHVVNRGTSMSAPMVAGAVALYLECQRSADYSEIKQALQRSAKIDAYVFRESMSLPNIHWGYGKLDVSNLVKSCLVYGCMDSMATNFNPLAMVSDSSCAYWFTASEGLKVERKIMNCYPNPAKDRITIDFVLNQKNISNKVEILICNSLGEFVFQQNIKETEGQVIWQKKDLPSGVYLVVLKENGIFKVVQKVTFLF